MPSSASLQPWQWKSCSDGAPVAVTIPFAGVDALPAVLVVVCRSLGLRPGEPMRIVRSVAPQEDRIGTIEVEMPGRTREVSLTYPPHFFATVASAIDAHTALVEAMWQSLPRVPAEKWRVIWGSGGCALFPDNHYTLEEFEQIAIAALKAQSNLKPHKPVSSAGLPAGTVLEVRYLD